MDRGRADAAMIWGEESAGQSERFAAKLLTPAEYLDAEHATTVGVSEAAPPVNPERDAAGNAPVANGLGQGAWQRRLSPHHRDAVKQFFTPPHK